MAAHVSTKLVYTVLFSIDDAFTDAQVNSPVSTNKDSHTIMDTGFCLLHAALNLSCLTPMTQQPRSMDYMITLFLCCCWCGLSKCWTSLFHLNHKDSVSQGFSWIPDYSFLFVLFLVSVFDTSLYFSQTYIFSLSFNVL